MCLGSVRPRASQATAVRRITEAADRGVHPRRICSPATAGSTDRESNYDSVSFRQDSGSSASTSSVIDVNDKAQTESKMDELQQFLRAELDRIFGGGVNFRLSVVFALPMLVSSAILILLQPVCAVSQPGALCS